MPLESLTESYPSKSEVQLALIEEYARREQLLVDGHSLKDLPEHDKNAIIVAWINNAGLLASRFSRWYQAERNKGATGQLAAFSRGEIDARQLLQIVTDAEPEPEQERRKAA